MNFLPCIYALVDPLEPEHIRYIGKTRIKRRPRSHEIEAKKCLWKDTYKLRWIRKLLLENRTYNVFFLEQFPEGTEDEILFSAEIRYIAEKKQLGHKLTNATDGGDGLLNLSQEILNERSTRMTKLWKDPKFILMMERKSKERWNNLEFLAKQKEIWTLERRRQSGARSAEVNKERIGEIRTLEGCINHSKSYYSKLNKSTEIQIENLFSRIKKHAYVVKTDPTRKERSLGMMEFLLNRIRELQTGLVLTQEVNQE